MEEENSNRRGRGIPKRRRNQISQNENDEDRPDYDEEAEEDPAIFENEEEAEVEQEPEEEEEEGEDLLENMERDYEQIPELDQYEEEGLDHQEYERMDEEQKREVEEQLRRRDLETLAHTRRIPGAFLSDMEEDSFDDDEVRRALRRNRQRDQYLELGLDDGEDEQDDEKYLDLEEARGKLPIWIKEPRTVRWIRRHFRRFLMNFADENSRLVYENRINEMCASNKQSLEVTFIHISKVNPTLAVWIADFPALTIPYLNTVSNEVANHYFPGYENIHSEIYVRIKDLPIEDNLRDLRHSNLNSLIRIKGVVTKRSAVFSQLKKAYYICNKCGNRKGPIFYNTQEDIKLGACAVCQSSGPFQIDADQTVYRNYQKITVQETPGTVPPGRVPRHKDIILLGDNIDLARPGDEIEVTGIYTIRLDHSLNAKHGFPVFSTIIEANYIRRISEAQLIDLPDEDRNEIKRLAKLPNISKLIINSIAPSIFGHNHIKTAIALTLFGGEAKDIQGKHKIRGDINLLLLGDPGTAKSQFLKYVEKTFHRCIYTTGKGASAVGLTASVHKDQQTREWTLEGGALVLADKGICLIDEFDKMNEHDRTSIHEAMEQQTISISKAGIVANLSARCSIIAAANPVKGRYDSQLSFLDNVDLSEPILSRFDILCVVKDEVDPNIDYSLATFVINSHIKSHPNNQNQTNITFLDDPQSIDTQKNIIPQDLLKKYIMYARQYVKPRLTEINKDKLTKFYQELREESKGSGGFNVSIRHFESIIRMAEAHAKMHLRDYVREDDIDLAISVMLESFIQSQKFSVSKLIKKKFSKYIKIREDTNSLLLHILGKLVRDQIQYMQILRSAENIDEIKIPLDHFEAASKEMQIHDISEFLNSESFRRSYQLRGRVIIRTINI